MLIASFLLFLPRRAQHAQIRTFGKRAFNDLSPVLQSDGRPRLNEITRLARISRLSATRHSAQSLRTLARATDGRTAKVFGMLNELAVEAIGSGKEQITDEDVESWKPAREREAIFA